MIELADASGNPLTIRNMILIKQISDIPCLKGVNYNFFGSTITTFGGCSGTFRLCYEAPDEERRETTTTLKPLGRLNNVGKNCRKLLDVPM